MKQAMPTPTQTEPRRYLMLQGPHGPFFAQLAQALEATGAPVHRVGFNAGDAYFWRQRAGYIAYTQPLDNWRDELGVIMSERATTDVILYGDTRPIHATAIKLAQARGIRVHVFEEGYLRPYWVSYERDGSNGHSELCKLSIAQMRQRLPVGGVAEEAPDHWGALRRHMFYGALYHFCVLVANRTYRRVARHRELSVGAEFWLHLKRLALLPVHGAQRWRAQSRVFKGGFAYHLVLMQLPHDANFIAHAPFAGIADFVRKIMVDFAQGAPAHHHLVFKAHPLDDGRENIRKVIAGAAQSCGLSARVHFIRGGKLGRLLDPAVSCVTVNSTAAQQALWRSVPLRAFGKSVYSKPELVSNQPLGMFFRNPAAPDHLAYLDYRSFLLATSQLPGSYYSRRGRAQVLRRVVDAILAPQGPYALPQAENGDAARTQHLGIVS